MTSNPTSICRCSKRPATSRRRSTPSRPEIFAHAQRIGKHFNLYERACFQTQSQRGALGRGGRTLDSHDRSRRCVQERVLSIMSSGPLNRPKLPGIPGIEKFKGHTFHTSRWDYDYTGGDTTGGLHKLNDKRVGIIGTGATAIQCVPHLGEHAKQLYVFQRTPSSVDERNNTADRSGMGEDAQARMAGLSQPQLHCPLGRDPASRKIRSATSGPACFKKLGDLLKQRTAPSPSEEKALLAEIADFQKMNEIRGRVAATVKRSRRRPRRSSRGTGSGASVRPSTTSTCPPSTGPTSSSWTPRARASIA